MFKDQPDGLRQFPDAPLVSDDPVPYATEMFRRYGAFQTDDEGIPTIKAMSAALGAVASLIEALNPTEHRYSVRFAPIATAATEMEKRFVVITTRPMLHPGLTEGQRAAIMLGLGYHESGHIIYSDQWHTRLQAKGKAEGWSKSRMYWALRVLNLGHDVMLEHLHAEDFPGFRNTLDVKNIFNSTPWTVTDETVDDRWTIGLQRGRFPWASDWTGWDHEVAYWDGWFAKVTTRRMAEDVEYAMEQFIDALDHIRPDEPDPEPEEGEEPEPRPGTPEGEDPFGTPPSPKAGGEEEEGEEQTQPAGGEGSESEGSGSGEGESEEGEPAEGEGEGGPESEGEGEGESGSPAQNEGEEAEMPTGKVETSTDPRPTLHGVDWAEDTDWQQAVDEYERTQVKARDKRIVGSSKFRKREVRIIRLEVN